MLEQPSRAGVVIRPLDQGADNETGELERLCPSPETLGLGHGFQSFVRVPRRRDHLPVASQIGSYPAISFEYEPEPC